MTRRFLALVVVALTMFGLISITQTSATASPVEHSPAAVAEVHAPSYTTASGCYVHSYNRNGSYAVCRSRGGYYRAEALCSTGKTVFGHWVIANGGNNHSDAWCTPYNVLSARYRIGPGTGLPWGLRAASSSMQARTPVVYANCSEIQVLYDNNGIARGGEAWCPTRPSWRVVVGFSSSRYGPVQYTGYGPWMTRYESVRSGTSKYPYARWVSYQTRG